MKTFLYFDGYEKPLVKKISKILNLNQRIIYLKQDYESYRCETFFNSEANSLQQRVYLRKKEI